MTDVKLWTVRLKALAGPNPLGGEALAAMEETLTVRATTKLEAKDKGLLSHTLKLRGHELEVWIDGQQYFDPRF